MPSGVDLAGFMLSYGVMALLGLILGSFATALVYRIPRGIPWTYDSSSTDKACRSRCPSCGTTLGVADLVPFFSWLLAGGKCRHCKAPVPRFYPLVELATMALVLLLFYVSGFAPWAWPLYMAVPFLLAALLIDWEHMILPDSINLSLFLLACVYNLLWFWQAGWDVSVLAGPVIAALLLTCGVAGVAWVLGRIKGRTALGMGDLKFLAPAGLFLGLAPLPSFLALSGLLGLFVAALRRGRDGAFPFGPALIISLYIHLILTGLGFDYKW